ncbi:hypothetical protein FQZ97_872180 [compost metagenome]
MAELDLEQVVRGDRLHQPVAAGQVGALGDVGAEQAIEHDQHAAVVAVQVLQVRGVVHAVGRGRVEHPFERAELRNPGRVNPELVEQVQREHQQDDPRRHAQERRQQEEGQRAGEPAGPAEAVGGRQVQLVRRMVHGVGAPEPAHAVRGAVVPVVAELLADEAGEPAGPVVHRQREEPVGVEPVHGADPEGQRQQPAQRVFAHQEVEHRDARRLPVVAAPAVAPRQHQRFGQRGKQHHRDGNLEDQHEHGHGGSWRRRAGGASES